MRDEEFNYWFEKKQSYENSLKNNVGHRESIKNLLEKIHEKLAGRHTMGNK